MVDTVNEAAPRLIRRGRLEQDDSATFAPAAGDDARSLPERTGMMVPLAFWLAHADALRKREHAVGIVLTLDDEPAALLPAGGVAIDPAGIALIAVDFSAFIDGRGFTHGEMLRSRYGWTGELRAVGDVLIDTMHYLARCGFDSFLVKESHDPRLALNALHAFSHHYQTGYAEI